MEREATVRKQLEACSERARLQLHPVQRGKITSKSLKYSKNCARRMSRKVIIQFFRAIRLARDSFMKGNGNGVLGPPHLRPRRNGQDCTPGGPLESGRTTNDFFLRGVSVAGNGESLVSDGVCKQHTAPCTSHTPKLLARGSRRTRRIFLCVVSKTVIFTSAS